MPYKDKKKNLEYQRSYRKKNPKNRRKYFRDYERKNKERRKAISLMGDIAKIMKTNNQLSKSIEGKTELIIDEQAKLDRKLNQIKKFLNIK